MTNADEIHQSYSMHVFISAHSDPHCWWRPTDARNSQPCGKLMSASCHVPQEILIGTNLEHKTMPSAECNDRFCRRPEHYTSKTGMSKMTIEDEIQDQGVVVILPELTSDFASPVDDLLREHLYPAIQLFRRKAKDYSEADGFFTADHLGAAGQYGDLFRKMPKLKKSMWDGEKLEGEQPLEILQDFLGHVLLAIGYLSGWRKQ